MNRFTLKRMAAIRRETQRETLRHMQTQDIPSKKAKMEDPRKQRKQRNWQFEASYAF
jgi:hypothetical protein